MELLARKSTMWQTDTNSRNDVRVLERNPRDPTVDELNKKFDVLLTRMNQGGPQQHYPVCCVTCGGDHPNHNCGVGSTFSQPMEEVNYIGGNQPYNPSFQNNQYFNRRPQHPNFSYGNNQHALRPSAEFYDEFRERGLGKAPMDAPSPHPTSTRDDQIMSLLKDISGRLANNEAYCRDLANQLAHLTRESRERPQGRLPSSTEENPKGGSQEADPR